MIKKLFLEHPASVDETYFEHMKVGLSFAANLSVAAIAVAIHAFLPFLFVKTASNIIERLYNRMVANRSKVTNRANEVVNQLHEDKAHAEN